MFMAPRSCGLAFMAFPRRFRWPRSTFVWRHYTVNCVFSHDFPPYLNKPFLNSWQQNYGLRRLESSSRRLLTFDEQSRCWIAVLSPRPCLDKVQREKDPLFLNSDDFTAIWACARKACSVHAHARSSCTWNDPSNRSCHLPRTCLFRTCHKFALTYLIASPDSILTVHEQSTLRRVLQYPVAEHRTLILVALLRQCSPNNMTSFIY
jgi:hypothetical protein